MNRKSRCEHRRSGLRRLRGLVTTWAALSAWWSCLCSVAGGLAACLSPPETSAADPLVQVARNPYAGVNWSHDLRLKTALHDHVEDRPAYLKRMDAAGYHAVPIMHYSGVTSLPYTWSERHWPAERVLPPELFAELNNIRLFFPSAEEVGYHHMTSPLLTTYIAKWEPEHYVRREAWHYGSTQEAIDLIQGLGGLAFIAHPWEQPRHYDRLRRFTGMEIYNAYCRHKFQTGEHEADRNPRLLSNWDRALLARPSVVGIAVNDWYGPWKDRELIGASEDVYDSGKVIVLAREATLEAFRTALAGGAVLAVKDLGKVKDRFAEVRAITVDTTAIRIELEPGAEVEIHWIADGERLEHGAAELPLSLLASGARYVRAEIVDSDGSTTYTQAFALRPKHLLL
jgi:hypothetical protein